MKKNVIIGVLIFTILSFLLFSFVQKTKIEELRINLREAQSIAKMYEKQAEEAKIRAIEARKIAEKESRLAQVLAYRAIMEAAQKPK